MKTNNNYHVCYDKKRMMTSMGPLTVKSLVNAQIS